MSPDPTDTPPTTAEKEAAETTADGPLSFESLASPENSQSADADEAGRNIDLLKDVTLRVKVELGRGKMFLRNVLRLTDGSVVELDKAAGDPLEIFINDRLVGKGEVLVLNENFCVRITQIYSPEECIKIKGLL